LEAFEGPIVSHQIPPPSLLSFFSLGSLLSLALSGFGSTDFAIEGSTRLTSKQAIWRLLLPQRIPLFDSSHEQISDFFFLYGFFFFLLWGFCFDKLVQASKPPI
jgi:hypothetical protein